MTTLRENYPFYLANEPKQSGKTIDLIDKFTGSAVAKIEIADALTIDGAIAAAVESAPTLAAMASYERQNVLQHCVNRFQDRFEEIAEILCIEAGKPIKDSRGEVTRLIDTFKIAAEEALRLDGSLQTLDISPRSKGYRGMWKRVPIGPCSFISPFNLSLIHISEPTRPY